MRYQSHVPRTGSTRSTRLDEVARRVMIRDAASVPRRGGQGGSREMSHLVFETSQPRRAARFGNCSTRIARRRAGVIAPFGARSAFAGRPRTRTPHIWVSCARVPRVRRPCIARSAQAGKPRTHISHIGFSSVGFRVRRSCVARTAQAGKPRTPVPHIEVCRVRFRVFRASSRRTCRAGGEPPYTHVLFEGYAGATDPPLRRPVTAYARSRTHTRWSARAWGQRRSGA